MFSWPRFVCGCPSVFKNYILTARKLCFLKDDGYVLFVAKILALDKGGCGQFCLLRLRLIAAEASSVAEASFCWGGLALLHSQKP